MLSLVANIWSSTLETSGKVWFSSSCLHGCVGKVRVGWKGIFLDFDDWLGFLPWRKWLLDFNSSVMRDAGEVLSCLLPLKNVIMSMDWRVQSCFLLLSTELWASLMGEKSIMAAMGWLKGLFSCSQKSWVQLHSMEGRGEDWICRL